jgi:hypothetical protein
MNEMFLALQNRSVFNDHTARIGISQSRFSIYARNTTAQTRLVINAETRIIEDILVVVETLGVILREERNRFSSRHSKCRLLRRWTQIIINEYVREQQQPMVQAKYSVYLSLTFQLNFDAASSYCFFLLELQAVPSFNGKPPNNLPVSKESRMETDYPC